MTDIAANDITQPLGADDPTTYYADASGIFLGAWVGAHDAPQGGVVVPNAPSDAARSKWNGTAWVYAPIEYDYLMAVQHLLDSTAQQRNYDNILSACTYANSSVAKFKAEGLACLAWRDQVWAQCYASLAAVQAGQAGQMAQPSVAAFVASLPQLTWPS